MNEFETRISREYLSVEHGRVKVANHARESSGHPLSRWKWLAQINLSFASRMPTTGGKKNKGVE